MGGKKCSLLALEWLRLLEELARFTPDPDLKPIGYFFQTVIWSLTWLSWSSIMVVLCYWIWQSSWHKHLRSNNCPQMNECSSYFCQQELCMLVWRQDLVLHNWIEFHCAFVLGRCSESSDKRWCWYFYYLHRTLVTVEQIQRVNF